MIRSAAVEVCVALGFVSLGLLDGPWLLASSIAWGVSLALRLVGRRAGTTLPLLLLVVGAVALAAGGARGLLGLENMVVAGLILLQLQRRATRRGPTDDRVSVVVAGLMLVVCAGRSDAAGFLAVAVGWAAALPLALLPAGRGTSPSVAHLVAGGGVHLLLTITVFVLLPRRGTEVVPLAEEDKLVGFAPDVELGALGELLDDPTVAFRARVEGRLDPPIYWRGLALDGFDGRRWYSSTPPVPVHTDPVGEGVRVTVTPAGPSSGALFVPGRVLWVDADDVRGDSQGAWFVPAEASVAPYTVQVEPRHLGDAWFEAPDPSVETWLQLPAVDARVSELARRVAGEGEPVERAERLVQWLREEVHYSRRAGDLGPKPLTTFLLESREGHCEYVSAGLVVLLRSEGIPARVVNGFLGGDVDPLTGELVVRRRHAHSWTEALLDGRWVQLDATPEATNAAGPPVAASQRATEAVDAFWQREVVGYDRGAQQGRLRSLQAGIVRWGQRPLWAVGGGAMFVALVVGLSMVGLRLWRRRLPVASGGGAAGLRGPLERAEEALAASGLHPPSSAPPVERARWLRDRAPSDVADAFEALAWLHYEVVFAGVSVASVRARSRALVEKVEQGLRRPAPPR